MRVDPDVVRDVLVAVARLPFDGGPHQISVEGRTADLVAFHVMALHEHGFLKAVNASSSDGPCWMPIGLTYEGSEFLAAAESDTVWARAKEHLLSSTGTITIEGLKIALPYIVKTLIT